jgi:hypothetical protein
MPSPDWNDDDALERELRRALQREAVDQQIIDAARAVFTWRSIDTDLELVRASQDSTLGTGAGVRGPAGDQPRTLVFPGEHVGVEIEVCGGEIEGQLIPPQPGRVALLTEDGTYGTAIADEVGCFAFRAVPRGRVRLDCFTDGARLMTEWLTI